MEKDVEFGSGVNKILRTFEEEGSELSKIAEERGLKKFNPNSNRAWVDSDYETGVPMHFYIRYYPEPGSKPQLLEYSLKFPITDYSELLEFVKSMEELYLSVEGSLAILSHNPRGFVKYLQSLDTSA